MMGLIEFRFVSSFMLVGLLATVFWIWMLVDGATKEPNEGNGKLVWTLIIVLTHVIGAVIYFFVRRPERMARQGT